MHTKVTFTENSIVPKNNLSFKLLNAFPVLFRLNVKIMIFDKIWRCDLSSLYNVQYNLLRFEYKIFLFDL